MKKLFKMFFEGKISKKEFLKELKEKFCIENIVIHDVEK